VGWSVWPWVNIWGWFQGHEAENRLHIGNGDDFSTVNTGLHCICRDCYVGGPLPPKNFGGSGGHFAPQIFFLQKSTFFDGKMFGMVSSSKTAQKIFFGGWGPVPPNFSSAYISETVRNWICVTVTIIVALGEGNSTVYCNLTLIQFSRSNSENSQICSENIDLTRTWPETTFGRF
jgi:hypothetical protein